jgi:hypothetical protein
MSWMIMKMRTRRKIIDREDKMKLQKISIVVSVMFLLCLTATVASAADFDWLKDFNIQAQADLSGFKARLSARFNIGDAQVNAVISNVPDPGDAYMVLRLGEMSSKPTQYVIEQYKSGKHQGWGALAKSLGIKPGSAEFKALKSGSDMGNPSGNVKDKNKGQDKGKNKGKGKEK